MTLNVEKEVAALEQMNIGSLRERYSELQGETTQSRNRKWLIRRIIWRMQSLEEGGFSNRALERARELAGGADLRVSAPRNSQLTAAAPQRTQRIDGRIGQGSRIPLPGTVITRPYKGKLIQVKVVTGGFEHEGELYKSLSAVAKKVTGSHWNGFKFFNVDAEGESR